MPAEATRGELGRVARMVYVPRQIPVYLSFLEVIHTGGLSAHQAKNVQFVFREKAKHLLRLHLCSTLKTATLQTHSPSA